MVDYNYFIALNNVDCSDKVETIKTKKATLTYLSWAWAWGELKKRYPTATYTVYENAQGWNYHTDGRTAWVKTGVTVEGIEHIEMLPVMDRYNDSIPVESLTSTDVNKAIQRSLTKACARHGLGLYIYAGEDLPEEETDAKPIRKEKPAETVVPTQKPSEAQEEPLTDDERADLWDAIPDEDGRRRTQELYGERFERMTRRTYNVLMAKAQKLREAGA